MSTLFSEFSALLPIAENAPTPVPVVPRPDVSYLTADDLPRYSNDLASLSLSGLQFGIEHEKNVLHVPASELRKSFLDGDAVIAIDKSSSTLRPFGYARLERILPPSLRATLGIAETFPQIEEAGTMFIENNPRYRGKGHLPKMCESLFQQRAEQLARGELLIIGTSKDVRIFKALDDMPNLNFEACHHHKYPFVAAFTCICRGEFGKGYQFGINGCAVRVSDEFKQSGYPLPVLPSGQFKINCTMFVSDPKVAQRCDDGLRALFSNSSDPLQAMVNRLMELRFYPGV